MFFSEATPQASGMYKAGVRYTEECRRLRSSLKVGDLVRWEFLVEGEARREKERTMVTLRCVGAYEYHAVFENARGVRWSFTYPEILNKKNGAAERALPGLV